jgi:hypothetical protein
MGVSNDTGRVMTPTGSILFPPKPQRGFVGSLSYFRSKPIFKAEEKDFGLASIVNENFGDVPSINVNGDDHGVGMRKRS